MTLKTCGQARKMIIARREGGQGMMARLRCHRVYRWSRWTGKVWMDGRTQGTTTMRTLVTRCPASGPTVLSAVPCRKMVKKSEARGGL